jgi:hypothetical protein
VNASVAATGVAENTYESPLVDVVREVGFAVEATVKSVGCPVVDPDAADTEMVQITGLPMRAGLTPTHDKVDACVGVSKTCTVRDPP